MYPLRWSNVISQLQRGGAPRRRDAALAAMGWLVVAGILLPFSLAFLAGLTGLESSPLEYTLAGAIVLAGTCGGGAAFGRSLARLAELTEPRRLAWAGALTFAPGTLILGLVLGLGEPAALRATGVPVHVLFALMFVPAVFVMVALLSIALGIALRSGRLAAELVLKAAPAAALAFLAADVIQDLLGRRVGGPNAAATATMVTVALVGCLAAAAAMGAVMLPILQLHARGTGAAATSVEANVLS